MTNDLAIRILSGDVLGTTEQTHEAVSMAVKALSALPASQPERLKGHWIPIDEYSDVYECDVCRTTYDTVGGAWDLPCFCPHCGADMRGGVDDERPN